MRFWAVLLVTGLFILHQYIVFQIATGTGSQACCTFRLSLSFVLSFVSSRPRLTHWFLSLLSTISSGSQECCASVDPPPPPSPPPPPCNLRHSLPPFAYFLHNGALPQRIPARAAPFSLPTPPLPPNHRSPSTHHPNSLPPHPTCPPSNPLYFTLLYILLLPIHS